MLKKKEELVKLMVSEGLGKNQREAGEYLDKFMDVICKAITEHGGFSILGKMKFEVVDTKPRIGRNPQTGEEFKIEAGKRVKFTAGKELKDNL